MNENALNNDNNSKQTYHATTNFNIDLENPQININSAVGVNIKSNENSNLVDNIDNDNDLNYQNQFNDNFASFDNGSFSDSSVDSNYNNNYTDSTNVSNNQNISHDQKIETISNSNQFVQNNLTYEPVDVNSLPNNDSVKYEPILEKKQKKITFSVSTELKIIVFIVFILLVFILLMPYIYDFFKNLQLSLMG